MSAVRQTDMRQDVDGRVCGIYDTRRVTMRFMVSAGGTRRRPVVLTRSAAHAVKVNKETRNDPVKVHMNIIKQIKSHRLYTNALL